MVLSMASAKAMWLPSASEMISVFTFAREDVQGLVVDLTGLIRFSLTALRLLAPAARRSS